jgi:hypothetical protein
MTDVRGSTKAIEAGRYREVNLIGAASVNCILNALHTYELPFVFGGDGATILIPSKDRKIAAAELRSLQKLAQNEFGIDLRAGMVSMAQINDLGSEIKVGKYELSPGNYTAQLKGGGVTLAEQMVKYNQPEGATILKAQGEEDPPQLEGLSCRVDTVKSKHGNILSVLIKPNSKNQNEVLESILSQFKSILNDDFLTAAPVSLDRLNWSWPFQMFWAEVMTQKRTRSRYFQILFSSAATLFAKILLTFNIRIGNFEPEKYKRELVMNSDFKKFDDVLRMVIDCSNDQCEKIESFLEQMKQQNLITYGTHKSKEAVLTCIVQSASKNRHVHFVDGGNGGYATAALQMKKS